MPISELNAIRREFRQRRLGAPVPEPQDQEATTPDLGSLLGAATSPQPQVAATTPPPVVAQAGPATAPSAGPAPTSMANAITLPNPQDQLLAARLRGQQ